MFGRKKKESHTENNQNVGTINLGMAGYFGGIISIPDPEGVEIYLHDDRIEFCFMKSNSTLEIPYRNITSIENMTKAEFSLVRGKYFPLPELVTYTKIQYQENLEDRYVVIDLDMSLNFALDFLNKKTQEYTKDEG
jgi:hypothetical protein